MSALKRQSVPAILAGVTALFLLLAALAATVWKPPQYVEAVGNTEAPFISTREGMLGLYGDSVTITATAPDGQPVYLAFGSQEDVTAWLQGSSYVEAVGREKSNEMMFDDQFYDKSAAQSGEQSGLELTPEESAALAEWARSQSGEQSGEGAQSGESQSIDLEAYNPISSDMWIEAKAGVGTVSMQVPADLLDSATLVATTGTLPAPTLTLAWPNKQVNILLIAFGALAVLSAAGTLVAYLWARRAKAEELAPPTLESAVDVGSDPESFMAPGATPALSPPAGDADGPAAAADSTDGEAAEASTDTAPVEAVVAEVGAEGWLATVEAAAAEDAAEGPDGSGADADVTAVFEAVKKVAADDTDDALPAATSNEAPEAEASELDVYSPDADAPRAHGPAAEVLAPEAPVAPDSPTSGEFMAIPESFAADFVADTLLAEDQLAAQTGAQADQVEAELAPDTDSDESTEPGPYAAFGPPSGAPAAPASTDEPAGVPAQDAAPKTPARHPLDHSETLTTESGMINMTAMLGGGKFPTRAALRAARAQGVPTLIVDGREFDVESGMPTRLVEDDVPAGPAEAPPRDRSDRRRIQHRPGGLT